MNLNQVTIPSINVNNAVKFYEKLGFKLIVDSTPRYVRFEVPDGEATFSIHSVNKLPNGQGITLYFECDNLDDKVTELKQKGINFTLLPTDQKWLWREAHLNDLDGNSLILYFAGDNRKNPPWKIN
ncbi:VOC family protein [Urechidicola croceus]|uniref:Bleomycin resistance protein n=1 Tax=Urechidicola croceus TaxID=1850246 RepID=A0A1D8P8J9_9FLAO|nr:VOC family protein [Urechidicola croceus]AOW20871.1 bleomycin resistance protein [Urechidicola croceus]